MTDENGDPITVTIEWTSEELATIRRVQSDAKARRELFDKIEAGLNEAKERLSVEQDAMSAIAAKIAEGGSLTFDEKESGILADALGAWLLRFARDDMRHTVYRDDISRGLNERRYAIIGNGQLWV